MDEGQTKVRKNVNHPKHLREWYMVTGGLQTVITDVLAIIYLLIAESHVAR
jgi:hypothetical protein